MVRAHPRAQETTVRRPWRHAPWNSHVYQPSASEALFAAAQPRATTSPAARAGELPLPGPLPRSEIAPSQGAWLLRDDHLVAHAQPTAHSPTAQLALAELYEEEELQERPRGAHAHAPV